MRKQTLPWARAFLAAAGLVLALAGCGGGGGTPPAAPEPQSVVISGVAAEGAPMSNAAIRLFDATGAEVATAEAGTDGRYTLTVPLSAKPPFVVSAAKEDLVYYSPIAEAKTGTINITKLTNLIAAQLSPTGDPAALAGQIASGAATVDVEQVRQVVAAVVEALRPLLENAGSSIDPISGSFAADGSGHDQVLAALDIAINTTGELSNITVTVKAAVADGEQPPAISFTSGSTPPALPASVATATLPESDTDAVVEAFLDRIEACYALPLSQRVNGTTAASVIASACRTLFSGDDPANFLNNGVRVGSTGAFSGLFRGGATGHTTGQPVVEFLKPDGRMLLRWKSTGTDGGVSYSRVWLVRENGALKAIGNQYAYPFSVKAWSEARSLVNTPALSYWNTGFNVSVSNLQTSGGTPLFDKVVVTAPNGRTITLVPNGGLSYLPVQGTTTSVVRLAGKFMDAGTSGVPRRLSSGTNSENLAWATNPDGSTNDWSEDQVKAINNVGRWKADFYLASAPTAIAATQYHETMTRPLTLSELVQRQWATLTAASLAAVTAESSANGNVALAEGDLIDLRMDGSPGDFWTVPAAATAPTYIQAQGFVANTGSNPAPRFNDNTTVSSVARTATIQCSTQGAGDAHCSSADATRYSGDARINLLQLIGTDAKEMEWVSNFGLYKLTATP